MFKLEEIKCIAHVSEFTHRDSKIDWLLANISSGNIKREREKEAVYVGHDKRKLYIDLKKYIFTQEIIIAREFIAFFH